MVAFALPEAAQAMARQEDIIARPPEAAVQFFRGEQERCARRVRKAGITPQ